jgi:sugar lactone lactonase YvrE
MSIAISRQIRRIGLIPVFTIGLTIIGSTAAPPPAPVVVLPGDRVYPENLSSTADGTLYIGSVGEGGVLRAMSGAAKAEAWIKPGAFGSRSIFGVLADEKSGTLWVCSNDLSGAGVRGPSQEKGAVLKGFDLKTGEGKISAPLPGDKTFCNDIAIGPDGAAYVTNTSAPQILRLPPGGKQLEVWVTDQRFQPTEKDSSVDGIAFGGDGNLYVDTFEPGKLFRIDVKDGKAGKVTKLITSRPVTLTDGMRPVGGNVFLMIEGDGHLDRVTVTGDTASIETLKDGFAEPAGVTLVGNTAYVSEAQLSFLLNPGKKNLHPSLPFHVTAVPLTGR